MEGEWLKSSHGDHGREGMGRSRMSVLGCESLIERLDPLEKVWELWVGANEPPSSTTKHWIYMVRRGG